MINLKCHYVIIMLLAYITPVLRSQVTFKAASAMSESVSPFVMQTVHQWLASTYLKHQRSAPACKERLLVKTGKDKSIVTVPLPYCNWTSGEMCDTLPDLLRCSWSLIVASVPCPLNTDKWHFNLPSMHCMYRAMISPVELSFFNGHN
jgi:hypothetical protein